MKSLTDPSKCKASLPVVCPDYDDDCLDMCYDHALQCYNGFPDNAHLIESGLFGPEGMGRACGHCPILARYN